MRINHNIAALNTYRQLSQNSSSVSESLEKLSSGLRINTAADDAAGLAISEKMRAQIRGLEQATRNAQDGISLIQTAEGALNETHSILQRMRELAVQASNDTNTAEDRAQIQKEIEQLVNEVDRIANTTEFNTKNLLNGDLGITTSVGTNTALIQNVSVSSANLGEDTYQLDIGAAALTEKTTLENSTISGFAAASGDFDLTDTKSDNLALGSYTLVAEDAGGGNFDLTLKDENGKVVATKSDADWTNGAVQLSGTGGVTLTLATNATATTGTADFSIEANIATADTVTLTGNAGTGSTIYSNTANSTTNEGVLDLGDMEVELTIESIQGNSGGATAANIKVNNEAATFQIGANEGQTTKVAISNMSSSALGVDDIDVSTLSGAQNAITQISNAITEVSSERAKLGAYQNRLEHTINNLGTSAQNLTAAESRIRDVDYAEAA